MAALANHYQQQTAQNRVNMDLREAQKNLPIYAGRLYPIWAGGLGEKVYVVSIRQTTPAKQEVIFRRKAPHNLEDFEMELAAFRLLVINAARKVIGSFQGQRSDDIGQWNHSALPALLLLMEGKNVLPAEEIGLYELTPLEGNNPTVDQF